MATQKIDEQVLSGLHKMFCNSSDEKVRAECQRIQEIAGDLLEGTGYGPIPKEASQWVNQRPFYGPGKNQDAFLGKVKEYIGKLPTGLMVEEMNVIQNGTPFSLMNGQPLSGKVKYGFADLFRLLGYPYDEGMMHMPVDAVDGKKGNPFYAPLSAIPNDYMNHFLENVLDKNPMMKMVAINKLAKRLDKEYKNKPGMGKDAKVKEIRAMIKDFVERYRNPYLKFETLRPEDLPISNYRNQNFHKVLLRFNRANQMKTLVSALKEQERRITKKPSKKPKLSKNQEEDYEPELRILDDHVSEIKKQRSKAL